LRDQRAMHVRLVVSELPVSFPRRRTRFHGDDGSYVGARFNRRSRVAR
jgi:hypothetical protein